MVQDLYMILFSASAQAAGWLLGALASVAVLAVGLVLLAVIGRLLVTAIRLPVRAVAKRLGWMATTAKQRVTPVNRRLPAIPVERKPAEKGTW